MTVITATDRSLNMATFNGYGEMQESVGDGPTSATAFSTINAAFSLRWNFTGTGFANFVAGIPTVGTITGITFLQNGHPVYSITELSMSVTRFLELITGSSAAGLLASAFAGNDVITGSSANDTLDGFAGADIISGGAGDDFIRVSGADTVDGGEGTDFAQVVSITFPAGSLGVVISAAAMASEAGQLLPGGAIVRNVEAFSIGTGAGDDTMVLSGDYLVSHAQAQWNAGGGTDRLLADLTESNRAVEFIYSATAPMLLFRGLWMTGVDEFHITGGSADDYFIGGSGNDRFAGGIGNDRLNGGGGLNGLFGGAGDDDIDTASAGDEVDGGDGHDLLRISRGSATTNLTISSREIASAEGWDLGDGTIVRNMEHLFETTTGSGDDVLDLESVLGRHSFYAGAGTDRLIVDMSDSTIAIRLRYRDVGWYEDRLWTSDFSQEVTWTNVEAFTLTSGSANDFLHGAAGDDVLSGGGGVDRLWGDGGSDRLEGGAGADVLDGGAGSDFAVYATSSAGVQVVLNGSSTGGDAEGDILTNFEGLIGSSFADRLSGDAGANTLAGADSDDVLNGYGGNDMLEGGTGRDVLIGGLGDDTLNGGDGLDTATYVDATAGVTVNLSITTAQETGGAGVDTLSSIERLTGSSFADRLTGNASDNLIGGGLGNDVVDGGAGTDTAAFAFARAGAEIVSWRGLLAVGGAGGEGMDQLTSIEQLQFSDQTVGASSLARFDIYGYIAGYDDLMVTYGVHNLDGAVEHFINTGYAQGRDTDQFSGIQYIAGYNDLIMAFGTDEDVAGRHYIQFGVSGGRVRDNFSGADYIASYNDLIMAFGLDEDVAARHYIQFGYSSGRSRDTFDGWQYIASYDDLIVNIGADEAEAARHFVLTGYGQGRARDVYNWLEYIAGHDDLIVAFGADETAGARHYVETGFAAGRARDAFDGLQYIASYADLIQSFGEDEGRGASHYIQFGFNEGRARDTFDAAQYLANYADLQAVFGSDLYNATRHYILYGFYEGRTDEDLTPNGGDDGLAILADKGDSVYVSPVEYDTAAVDKGDPGPAVLPDDADFGVLSLTRDDVFLMQSFVDTSADLRAKGIVMPPEWAVLLA